MSRTKNILYTSLFIGAFFFSGLGVLIWGFVQTHEAYESQSWPSVQGKVTRSEVVTSDDSDGDTTYGAEVTFMYRIDGQAITGTRVSLGGYSSSDPSHAEEIVARYPVGKTVAVYYNPQKPERAVLEPGLGTGLLLPLGLGSVFTLAGVVGIAWFIRRLILGQM